MTTNEELIREARELQRKDAERGLTNDELRAVGRAAFALADALEAIIRERDEWRAEHEKAHGYLVAANRHVKRLKTERDETLADNAALLAAARLEAAEAVVEAARHHSCTLEGSRALKAAIDAYEAVRR